MTVTYDPTTTSRLIAQAREDDARMTQSPWKYDAVRGRIEGPGPNQYLGKDVAEMIVGNHNQNGDGIARIRNNLRAMADQLEAATDAVDRQAAEIDRLYQRTAVTESSTATLEIAQNLLARWIKVGDLVNHSDVIGSEPTRLGLRVIEGPGQVGNGDWVVRLDGQHGWVLILAIRPSEHKTKGFTMTDAEFDEWMEASPRTHLLWEAWEASRESCASGPDPASRQRFTIWFHDPRKVSP